MKHPPLRRLFTTGTLAQMAIAKNQGGINWAERYEPDHEGILLFDNLEACARYHQRRYDSWPFVVCEFEREVVRVGVLVPVRVGQEPGERVWVYPEEIWFEGTWWHKYEQQQLVADAPEPVQPRVLAQSGTIVIPT